jgi:hypothetical protein
MKGEAGSPLDQAIFSSAFNVSSKGRDVLIESLTWNESSRMEKIAFLNDCREASSSYNSFSSDSSKWAWRGVGRTSRDNNR